MSSTVEKATGTQLGRDLSTLGEYTVTDEAVTGSVNEITGWTEFSSNAEQQNGYYVAINVEPWEGAKVRIDRTTGNGTAVALKGDGIYIGFMGKDVASAKTAQYITIIQTDGSEQKLDLSGLTYAE